MDRKTKTKSPSVSVDPEIEKFKRDAQRARKRLELAMQEAIWECVDVVFDELHEKKYLEETTARKCLVSYVIDALDNADLLTEKALCKNGRDSIDTKSLAELNSADLKNSTTYNILDQAFDDLVENQDIVENVARSITINHIIRQLLERSMIKQV